MDSLSIIAEFFPVAITIFTELTLFCYRFEVNSVKIAGIIAEYNPLHCGHVHLMEEIRRRLGPECAIVCAMSGDFVQRGDFALVNRLSRARAAAESGADLVLELPLPWAVSSAEGFARGGVDTLLATGLITHLAFGCETPDETALLRCARCLDSPAFTQELRRLLRTGASFAACRQAAAERILGPEAAELLRRPNNNLAVEYCRALIRRDAQVHPLALARLGAPHDHPDTQGQILSASAIRTLLFQGQRKRALTAMAPAMAQVYAGEEAAGRAPVFASQCSQALLYRLRSMEEEDFHALDTGNEGIYRRLYQASRCASSPEEILTLASAKRYAQARLRRMMLWAYLGLTPKDIPLTPLYLRVLAASKTGQALLRRMRTCASLPVITKPAHIRRLSAQAQALFAQEARAASLYALAYPRPDGPINSLWMQGPVML